MPQKNTSLHAAKQAKKDEFYTQLHDIEQEMKHYWDHFRGKTIFCNCDDPYESNFFKYFVLKFNSLGLKKVIATSYSGSPIAGTKLTSPPTAPYKAEVTCVHDATGNGGINMEDVELMIRNGEIPITELKGNGDFRSEECIELLKEADIVITNPPFSLFREFVAQLIEYNKQFIIIGNQNAITYKEISPLIKENKLWWGESIHSGNRPFYVPNDYPLIGTSCSIDEKTGRKVIRIKGVRWYTNIDTKQRHEEMILVHRYSPEEYPKYDNYDAIEVSKTKDIPKDYAGVMGVPITFLDKYNPDQFEIIKFRKGNDNKDLSINGRCPYFRILIRNLHPEPPKEQPWEQAN